MIGCDIVDKRRFKNLNRWRDKILGQLEKEYFYKCSDKKTFIASRWAIKEAIYKIKPINYCQINIIPDKNGKPVVFELPNFHISLSHEKTYCVAVAIEKEK